MESDAVNKRPRVLVVKETKDEAASDLQPSTARVLSPSHFEPAPSASAAPVSDQNSASADISQPPAATADPQSGVRQETSFSRHPNVFPGQAESRPVAAEPHFDASEAAVEQVAQQSSAAAQANAAQNNSVGRPRVLETRSVPSEDPKAVSSWTEQTLSEAESDVRAENRRMIDDLIKERATNDIVPVSTSPADLVSEKKTEAPKSVGGALYSFKGMLSNLRKTILGQS